MSNATIIEGDRDVLVVDSHVTPGGAWALREELKAVTPKPIRFVVNSHYHFDHSHGNQIYGPDVEIIGHEFARADDPGGQVARLSCARVLRRAACRTRSRTSKVGSPRPPTPRNRRPFSAQLDVQRNHLEGTKAVKPTPPNVTLTQTMTLIAARARFASLHLGRGHTAGDVIVHLPKERIIATGDLLVENTSYMGDAFFTEWIDTIEAVKQLDFDTVLPGSWPGVHGQGQARSLAGVPA